MFSAELGDVHIWQREEARQLIAPQAIVEAGDAAEAAESSAAEVVEEVTDTLPEGAERGCVWGLFGSLCISLYQFYLSRGHWMLWQKQPETDPTDPQTHPSNVEAWLTSPWHHSTKTLRQAVTGS